MPLEKDYLCTDIGNAERLIDTYHHCLRYNWKTQQWFMWDGRRWVADEGGVHRLAKQVAKDIYKETDRVDAIKERIKGITESLASGEGQGKETQELLEKLSKSLEKAETNQERLAKWFAESQNVRAINAMINLARSDSRIQVNLEEFDADPDFLNCQNGVLHLPSGKLHDHNPCYMLTKMVPCSYTPGARDAKFDALLEHVGQDGPEMAAFIQRAFGYSISGSNTEELSFFAIGPTQTGKTTLLEAVGATLGDYAIAIDSDSLMHVAGPRRGPSDDIARMAGHRFIYASETEEDRKLAVALFKKLFGGDQVPARAMYGKTFQFLPNFNMWLAFNERPQVKAADDAMWRRIVEVPFTHEVKVKNKKLKTYFRNPRNAGSAILAWLVAGYQDWLKHGLNPPERVDKATADYRASQDTFTRWLKDCAELDPDAWSRSYDDPNDRSLIGIYTNYARWCDENGVIHALLPKQFWPCLRARKCMPRQNRVGKRERGWQGIRLLVDAGDPTLDHDFDMDTVDDAAGTAGTAGTADL